MAASDMHVGKTARTVRLRYCRIQEAERRFPYLDKDGSAYDQDIESCARHEPKAAGGHFHEEDGGQCLGDGSGSDRGVGGSDNDLIDCVDHIARRV